MKNKGYEKMEISLRKRRFIRHPGEGRDPDR